MQVSKDNNAFHMSIPSASDDESSEEESTKKKTAPISTVSFGNIYLLVDTLLSGM